MGRQEAIESNDFEDVYGEGCDDLVENDEIDAAEGGFMRGYMGVR